MYDLERTKCQAERFIGYMMKEHFIEINNLFDLPVIESLVELFLPLVDGGGNEDGYVASGPSSILFDHLKDDFVHKELGKYPLTAINNNQLLGLLIYVQLKREIAETEPESETIDVDGPRRSSSGADGGFEFRVRSRRRTGFFQ